MVIMDHVSDVAALEKPVLIAGERGTGKELIANRLHFLSPRWEQVFVAVNCAAFDPAELDRELFGQTFLDGRDDTNGRFYQANGGTLFLDAVEHIPPYLQEKLIHVIEHGLVQATGELYHEDVDVRVVAATSVDLNDAVARGLFRQDLLDRLAFHVLHLPPLRHRRADIDPLVQAFGRRVVQSLGAERFPGLSAEAQEQIMAHPFPGNVRELKILIERSVTRAFLRDETLRNPITELVFDPFISDFSLPAFRGPVSLHSSPVHIVAPQAGETGRAESVTTGGQQTRPDAPAREKRSEADDLDFKSRVMTFERRLIDEAMLATKDHQGQAAERLGLSYHQFRGLLRKHGLKN